MREPRRSFGSYEPSHAVAALKRARKSVRSFGATVQLFASFGKTLFQSRDISVVFIHYHHPGFGLLPPFYRRNSARCGVFVPSFGDKTGDKTLLTTRREWRDS